MDVQFLMGHSEIFKKIFSLLKLDKRERFRYSDDCKTESECLLQEHCLAMPENG